MDQPGTPQVGSECLTTRRIGGTNRAVTSELTHIDPPRTWGVQGIDGPIRATVDLTVEPLTETSSRLTIAVDFDGHGIGKVARPAHRPPRSTERNASQPRSPEAARRGPAATAPGVERGIGPGQP